ncbi:MAG: serine/threonine protein kinase [Myxococcota bacterium]|nr:serine/threonine protein kinase [Myxococcota bacterium]
MRDATIPIGTVDGEVVPLARPARKKHGGRFGEYEVVAPLARGGMGGVYLAAHESTREKVAIKVVDRHLASHPEVVERLHSEHRIASSASHPCLVQIRDARMTADGMPYLVMEYLDGETLGAIADRGPIELGQAVAICAQVASAVAALHDAGVMHCDVKHDNVFVLDEYEGGWPRVKVIDFGVSRRVDEVIDDTTIAGTPWCMAPEQWRGKPLPASDVYSLGCLLYDLTTGAPPFDGSLPALMTAHLEQRPARPSWLVPMPMELERVILRALAKAPEDRPSMAEVARSLTLLADAFSEARREGQELRVNEDALRERAPQRVA